MDPLSEAIALVDRHLTDCHAERTVITIDEHTDVLLDVRSALEKLREGANA